MSETDDTDVLLLIPPDFFLVRSSGSEDSLLESSRTVVHKPKSCTAQVLGKLVDTVHSLESRLGNLELSTTITDSSFATLPRRNNWDSDSVDSRSVDSKYFTFPRRRRRKAGKKERRQDLSLTSFGSISSKKSIPRIKLRDYEVASIDSKLTFNDCPSMDGDLSSIVSTPSKKNDKLLLHEIDEFLTKVEAYESPEVKYQEQQETLSPENVIKATGNYISQKLNPKNDVDNVTLPSGKTVSKNVLDKYIYLVRNQSTSLQDTAMPSTSGYISQTNIEANNNKSDAIETPKADIYKCSESKSPSIRRLNFPDNKDVQPTSTPKKPVTSSTTNTFKPTTNKIYDRATKVLEQYKSNSRNQDSYTRNQDSLDTSVMKEEFKMPQMRPFVFENKDNLKLQSKFLDTIDTELLSLSELWGEKLDKQERGESIKLEEERLKREHCEAMIQQLQKKILDQQEKLAVAVKVDKSKDAAIIKLREAWVKLTGNLDKTEERHRSALNKLIRELENFKMVADDAQKRTNHFETELYKALDLAHDYQEKYKQVKIEMKQLQDNTEKTISIKDDILTSKDKEINVIKENYETIMRLNKQSTDCVKNIEDALEKERTDHEATKNKIIELSKKVQTMNDDLTVIVQERDVLREKVNEERARGDILERQLCDRQNQISDLLNKCDTLDSELKTLRLHIELQKSELKCHYQKQLEDAVLAKLQEFQQQLEGAEREMENEGRRKESAIVDAFNKQNIRIEEQHKLEIKVLEEKQKEEIKLYRLQLAQASERISLLESKVESFRRRRGEIANQLHGVMEAQWRQALKILTGAQTAPVDHCQQDSSGSCQPQVRVPAPRAATPHSEQLFNLDSLTDNEVQNYVKLLLNKPANLEASGDSLYKELEAPTSDRPDKDRTKRRTQEKPPWKA